MSVSVLSDGYPNGTSRSNATINGLTSPMKQDSTDVSITSNLYNEPAPRLDILDTAPVPNFNFKQTCIIREMHNQSVFGVAFNSINRSQSTDPLLFATVAGFYVNIYQCHLISRKDDKDKTSQPISLLQSFVDPSGDKEEFYCCAWSRDTSGNVASNWWTDCCETQTHESLTRHSFLPPHQQLVAAAGKRGVIRILCPNMASCSASLVGHGSAINELKFHPYDPALLFSFSKDYTIRLWNIATQVLVCIFGGAEGHRAEVLHGDLSLIGDLLLSAGMDHCIKIWRLDTPELANAIVKSFSYYPQSNKKPFPVFVQHFPEFSSRDVHGNYVDCAHWFGTLVISKSCENNVVLWKPGGLDDSSTGSDHHTCEINGLRLPDHIYSVGKHKAVPFAPGVPTEHKTSVIHQLKAPDCNLWYIRFDVDLKNQIVALGTGTGSSRVYLWDLSRPEDAFNLPAQVLNISTSSLGAGSANLSLSHSAIRQTRFADDGNILLCVGDNGLIVRFDKY